MALTFRKRGDHAQKSGCCCQRGYLRISGDMMSAKAGKVFDQGEAPAKAFFEQNGGQLIELAAEEKQNWKKIALTIGDQWVSQMNAKGLPGVDVLTATINLLVQVQ